MGQSHLSFKSGVSYFVLFVFTISLVPSSLLAPSLSGLGLSDAAAVEDVGANPAAHVNPGFDATLPPAFDAAKIAGQAQSFGSCQGGLQSAISSGIETLGDVLQSKTSNVAVGAGGFGQNSVCSGSEVGPSADALSCQSIAPGGNFSKSAFDVKFRSILDALGTIKCKKTKLQAVSAEVGCMTAQAQALLQQISAMQGAFKANSDRMQQDLGKIEEVIQDREAQSKDVLDKLGGTKESGQKGLLQIRDDLQRAIASTSGEGSVPEAIQKLQDANQDVKNQEIALQEAIDDRIAGLSNECFNSRPHAELRCKPKGSKNNPPVSAKQYVLCIFADKQSVNKNGQIEDSSTVASEGESQAQGLATLLDQITGQLPQKTKQSAPGSPPPDVGPAATLLTAADVEAQFGDQLRAFEQVGINGQSIPIHDVVMKNFAYCFQEANRTVRKERARKGSPIGVQQESLKKAQANLKSQGNTLILDNALKFDEAIRGLTGQSLPLNTAKCKNAAPETQVNCLRDIQANLEGILSGNVKQASVSMLIKGTNPAANIGFSCMGLNGCIQMLQNVDRNIKIEITRVQQFKQSYVQRARQSAESFVKQMGQQFSGQSAVLTNRLQAINTALASLGIGGINIGKVQSEPLQFDEKGLPIAPQSSLALIAGNTSPPLLDIAGDNLSGSTQTLADGVNRLTEKEGPLNEAMDKLEGLKMSCAKEALDKKLDAILARAEDYENAECSKNKEECEKMQTPIGNLMSTFLDIEPEGLDEEKVASIESALNNGSGCASTAQNTAQLAEADDEVDFADRKVKRVERELASCGTDQACKNSTVGRRDEAEELLSKAKKARNKLKDANPAKSKAICRSIASQQSKIRDLVNTQKSFGLGEAGGAR